MGRLESESGLATVRVSRGRGRGDKVSLHRRAGVELNGLVPGHAWRAMADPSPGSFTTLGKVTQAL